MNDIIEFEYDLIAGNGWVLSTMPCRVRIPTYARDSWEVEVEGQKAMPGTYIAEQRWVNIDQRGQSNPVSALEELRAAICTYLHETWPQAVSECVRAYKAGRISAHRESARHLQAAE